MTQSIKNCYALLRPLGLYRLSGATLVDCELHAYDAGFALVEQNLQELAQESLIQTACGYGLHLREEMLSLPLRPAAQPEKRRELLLYRLSVAPGDYNLAGMVRSVRAAGLNAKIVEDIPAGRIRIIEDGYLGDFETIDEVKENVRRMLPAHLEADFEIGNWSWADFERAQVDFDLFDSKNVTWSRLDIQGPEIFEGGTTHAKYA